MLHEILLSLWGCSTSVSQIIETDVSVYYNSKYNEILAIIEVFYLFTYITNFFYSL